LFQDLCTARTLRQRRLGRAVASRGRHRACPSRRDRDAQPAAHTRAARRTQSASAGWGGRSRRAGGTARVVPPRSRCAAGGTHTGRTARALRQRRPWRAVASRGRHCDSACPSRRDCDAPIADFPPPLASPGHTTFRVSARHNGDTVSGCLRGYIRGYIPRDIEAPRPGPCSRTRSHEPIAAGDRTRIAGVYIPLDWTTRAAPPDCADWCRRSRAGLTRVGTGRRRRLLRPEPWRAGNKILVTMNTSDTTERPCVDETSGSDSPAAFATHRRRHTPAPAGEGRRIARVAQRVVIATRRRWQTEALATSARLMTGRRRHFTG
jgi:hypothetical protein